MFSLRRKLRGFKSCWHLILDRVVESYNRRLASRSLVQLVFGVAKGIGDHLASDMAAGIAYYTILSMFPLLLGVIALLGLFLPQETVQEQILRFFAFYLPESIDIIQENIRQIIAVRGTLGVVSIGGLIWAGSMVFGGIGRVINQAWGIRRFRPFWVRKPSDIAIALSTGLLFFISVLFSILASILPVVEPNVVVTSLEVIIRVTAFLLALSAFAMLYKFMPNIRTYWSHIWPGALLATVMFEITRSLFVFFVGTFTNWELVYGQIGSVIAFLIWIFFSTYILIIGAEVSAEYDRMRRGVRRDARLRIHQSST